MLIALTLPTVALAASPRLPAGAPICARPGTPPVFLSPMGEPFRAAPGAPYPSAVWFAGADRDHDGWLTPAEMAADAARFFATLDLDHDGRLTPEEVSAYEHEVAPETSLFAARPDDFYERSNRRRHEADAMGRSADYGGPMGAGRYSWLNIPEPVAAADLDIDRVISVKEFAAAAVSAFDRLDITGRGRLRLADLPHTPAQDAIEGPCRPIPKAKHRDGEDPLGG